jgi:hypothetical protein
MDDVNTLEVLEERKKKKKGLWDNIWARRKAGKRPHRRGEKGYPKTLDIESAEIKELRRLIGSMIRESILGR